MDILLVHPEARVRDILSFILEEEFRIQVASAQDLDQALKHMEGTPLLVIYANRYTNEPRFKEFISKKMGIPAILITFGKASNLDRAHDGDITACISSSSLLDTLCVEIGKLVSVGSLRFKVSQDREGEYTRIRTTQLIYSQPLQVGVYIKLSNSHFVKIFNPGDRFDLNDLEHYMFKKKVEYFWVRKEDVTLFVTEYRKLLEERLKNDPVDPQSTADTVIDTAETIQSLATDMGFTEPIQQLVKANILLALKLMKSSPRLSTILARFEAEKDRYIPAHSTLTAFVACAISQEMGWGSEATFHKLTMAAFLHDAVMFNHNLAAVHDVVELSGRQGEFGEEEMKAYRSHPARAAEMVRSFSGAPADVDTIVLQHHETGDGKGFPRGLSASQVSPLAAVFILAHEIVDASIRGSKEIPVIVEALKDLYPSGNFKKILLTLDQKAKAKKK